MRDRLASLTARLVITAVALVAVVSVLVATATTLAMRSTLLERLDRDVQSSIGRANDHDNDQDSGPRPPLDPRYQGPGTLIANLGNATPRGCVLSEEHRGCKALSTAALDVLARVPQDGGVHSVSLPAFGAYRVKVVGTSDGDLLVTGLPMTSVQETVNSLIGWELLLTLLGTGAAAAAGLLVVRRQLRPLHEVASTAHAVAALPLASGEIDLTERVPAHLTDERTEVGQVGAALNTLLAHVESSLEARHRSEQQVRQFVADASHELRTPLATIAGYTELARRRPDESTVRTALGKVEEESGRMTSLVEDLLLLARLDAGRPLERKPVDLTRLLLEAVSDARVIAPDHRWRLELGDDAVEVQGDGQQLHQVVTNLLTNARKYTPAGTTVTVRAIQRDGMRGFAVHDDGPGFEPELAAHAFERFARGDRARTRGPAAGGAGLGLALVQAIVTAHGGTVALDSRPGDTTVSVELPLTGD
ncbi:cell wall metabolism sensor histidine kinase WalK [Nocardioides sp. LS1]|uniref:sensor histidine kinase n=1 Tax=Nocardioides sp. LS1 TaxID=1027620 RepID=UPI000F625E3F|nr:HAMP domain-containing sensor histidine kinase [Nocardioides sp. LS1]GCD91403.1 two-component sensor histidine kinase [Nocardioides sp. LS1]